MTEAMTLPAAHSAGAAGVVQGTRDPEQVTEMAMTDTVLAWDFESEDGRPGHGDGRFASERLIDALNHAKSPILRRVRLGGIVVRSGDRCAATERTSLWTMDGTDILRTFARQCAFDVIKVSGWQAPLVVMEYLTTGNEKLRSAAREATREATRNAARGVAWPPAWAATKDVAWEAAWETGWYVCHVGRRVGGHEV